MPTLTLSWTSASVPAGDSLVEHIAIPEGAEIEILKTKVTCSTDLGTSEFFIYRKTTALDADRALATAEWPNSSPFVHPIEDNAGVTVERTIGYPLLYIDESASGATHRLHVKYTNNSSVAATYDCVVTYRRTASSIIVPGVLSNFNDRSLWLPVTVGMPGTGGTATVTYNSDGSVTFNTAGNTSSESGSGIRILRGMRSKFRLMLDSSSILKYRLKFTDVTFPTSVTEGGVIAGLLALMVRNSANDWVGAVIGSRNGTSNLGVGRVLAQGVNGGTITLANPSITNLTHPSEPIASVELRVTVSKGTDSLWFTDVEYCLTDNDVFISIGASNDQVPELEFGFGESIFVGVGRGRIGGSIIATLKEFEILNGVAA